MAEKCELADAIVVGSGAAGGWAAKTLSEAGLRVLVLEAGPEVTPGMVKGFEPFRMVDRIARYTSGRQRMQGFHPAYWGTGPDLWVDDIAQPITTPPGFPFNWIRSNQVGGRTWLWGGVCLRLSDYDMKEQTREGFGFDWPISYDDLAPAYDRIELSLGIHGSSEGLPQLPDGRFLDAHPLTTAERRLKEAVERTWPDRRVIHSRGIDGTEPPPAGQRWNRLSSCGSSLADAIRTGRTTLQPCSLVTHLIPGTGGKAKGVRYIDTKSGEQREATAPLIVLCASAISSVLILLHTAAENPGGSLADVPALGHYLMDHTCTASMASFRNVPYHAPYPRTGAGGFFIPRYQNLDSKSAAFRGGFGIWGAVQRKGFSGLPGSRTALGFIVAHGDMEPRFENRVELGKGKDAWGLPIPHIDCRYSGNDLAMREVMKESIVEIVDKAGGKARPLLAVFDFPGPGRIAARLEAGWKEPPPGSYSHELGGARMGTDPKTSVVDPSNRCWAMPNVLVTDGACWPSGGWQNPAHTIMAVTVRACELAVRSMKAGEL